MQTSTNSLSIAAGTFEPLGQVASARRAAAFPPWYEAGLPSGRTSRRITLAKFLGVVLLCAGLSHAPKAQAVAGPVSVSLTWDRNPEPTAINYRVYYGTSSRQYAGSVDVGNLLAGSVSGLSSGVAYFFAVTALDAAGLESSYSSEIVFTPGGSGQPGGSSLRVQLLDGFFAELTVTGPSGQAYDILASGNFTDWTTLGSVLAGPDGLAIYVDYWAWGQPAQFYRALRKP